MRLRIVALLLTPLLARAQFTTTLSPASEQAFNAYARGVETSPNFHSVSDPATPVVVKGGLIHDLRQSTEIKGSTVDRVLALFRDYPNYKIVFAPDVVSSRLIAQEGNHWKPALGLSQTIFSVRFNTEYDVEYRDLGSNRWMVLSRSTKIAEVDGNELPVGTGHGFLWRLNAYWLIEPTSDGVYLECRSVSLSRDIPTGLAWAVKPIVTSFPRDSLRSTFDAIRRALRS